MLKMYHTRVHSGSTPDFWEENWEQSDFEESVRFCGVDPIRRHFDQYLTPESLMLEGGCGLGNYVSYYSSQGNRVIGVDFAERALHSLSRRDPSLNLIAGDVARMPFESNSFDLYYSGGVVEHFESGPYEALREAHRVLRSNGVLLITVPYFSPLRKLLSLAKQDSWKRVAEPGEDGKDRSDGRVFFQYAYTRREFRQLLEASKFRVIDTQGFAILWGLSELPGINRAFVRQPTPSSSANPSETRKIVGSTSEVETVSLAKRLAVMEDASVPFLGYGVKALRWAAANMMMYVCVPTK